MRPYPRLRRGLALAAALLVFAAVAWTGRDAAAPLPPVLDSPWPMYGGSPGRNLVNALDRNIPADFSVVEDERKHIKWAAELGTKARGHPVIAAGKIFVATNNGNPRDPKITGDKGVVMCFEEASGKFLWQAVHDKLPSGLVNDWPEEGIVSNPVVEGDRLWYVSNRCEVVCAGVNGKGTSADFIWRLDMMKDLGVFPHNLAICSPLLVGDRLFVVTGNGVDQGHLYIPAPKAPSFLCLDKNTGEVLWQSNLPSARMIDGKESFKELADRGEVLMHGQWSNPVSAVVNDKPQVIFPGGDGWLYSFEPVTGKLIWKFDGNPKNALFGIGGKGTRSDFIATPVVVDGKCYIGVGQDPEHKKGVGHLWCIDVAKGKDGADVSPELADWGVTPPKITPNPDSAAVWHFGGPTNDPKVRRRYVFGRTLSMCAVHEGLVYAADLDGFVYCLDAKTGAPHWQHEMRADTWCSPSVIDDKVFLGNDKGKLLIFQHGKDKKLLAMIDMEDRMRGACVAANGVLYAMTENRLYAIKK